MHSTDSGIMKTTTVSTAISTAARMAASTRSSASLTDATVLERPPRHIRIFRHRKQSELSPHQLTEMTIQKVVIDGDDGGVKMRQVHERIAAAVRMRTQYKKTRERPPANAQRFLPSTAKLIHERGVLSISNHNPLDFYTLPSWQQFASDVQKVRFTIGSTVCKQACAHRLGIIQERSRMFFLLNADTEEHHSFRKAGGVFSSVVKVDNAVLHSCCANTQETLDFIVDCCQRDPSAPISLRDGRSSTLAELLQCHGVNDPRQLTAEGLGWNLQAGRYDARKFSLGTNPLGEELSFTFLDWRGSMTTGLLRRVLERFDRATSCIQATEYSLPMYATYANELYDLAAKLDNGGLFSFKYNRWILHPLLMDTPPPEYRVECTTIQDQLDNVFAPLLMATLHPRESKHAPLARMMEHLGGFLVERLQDAPESDFDAEATTPDTVPFGTFPNALYYLYYMYAHITVLNSVRKRMGLNVFQLRTGGIDQVGMEDMLGGYLLADVITRATRVVHFPVLQYLFGLHGVGLSVSPLLDHIYGVAAYAVNPLPNFLHRCLNISISTSAPMLFHHSVNALVEEYATAQKIFRLSALDVTELARNSVIMSSFPQSTKREWLGDQYDLGMTGNEFDRSQVTNIRLAFREESWRLERDVLRDLCVNPAPPQGAGLSRWHYLSTVHEVEYNNVLDRRIQFPRTVLTGSYKDVPSVLAAAPSMARAIELRHKYIWKPPKPWEVQRHRDVEADFQRRTETFNEDEWTYAASDAVFISYPRTAIHAWPRSLPTLEDFHRDLLELRSICASPVVKEYAHKRLETLDHKFRLHLALNHANEAGTTEERVSSNRDLYQATKVDTHIHMAAGMTPKQMLQFVLKKLQDNADDIAMKKGDEIITLGQLFAKAGITTNLTVDQLNVQADHTLFERFDNFNNKYNPMENGDLRSLLLKTDNFMNGRYFAELIHNVFAQYSRDRYTYAENRLSVYGINIKEWDKLSNWFATHGMSSKHNKWIIQVPRVYKVFRSQNVIGSFGQYLQNIFEPLWEASLHPSEHPTLHNFLNHVSGFDSVDNEATIDLPFTPMSPWAWTSQENPPYNYYLYYLYANLRTLNEFRSSRGFTTFALRPHCGEAGSDEHLYGAYLCANSICHGINLRSDPPMQYLYYLTQIGLHVSPLSNNALFLHFLSNPFPDFFRRGLNVSLSTDDPMMFHQTQEPLLEEYSIAARVWDLSPNDLCEIARNSVLQCGFDYDFKREAIGDRWYMSSSLGNDPLRTHLSDIRVAFRFETYHTEMQHLESCSNRPVPRSMMTTAEEQEINEQNLDVGQEEIILSTHDQAMEVMLRDVEVKREQMRVARAQIDALRRQQHTLIDNIAQVGLQRQERQEKIAGAHEQLHYERAPNSHSSTFTTAESQIVDRLLRWRPMPAHVVFTGHKGSIPLRTRRPLPPIPGRPRPGERVG